MQMGAGECRWERVPAGRVDGRVRDGRVVCGVRGGVGVTSPRRDRMPRGCLPMGVVCTYHVPPAGGGFVKTKVPMSRPKYFESIDVHILSHTGGVGERNVKLSDTKCVHLANPPKTRA